jgi:hypothetical protein
MRQENWLLVAVIAAFLFDTIIHVIIRVHLRSNNVTVGKILQLKRPLRCPVIGNYSWKTKSKDPAIDYYEHSVTAAIIIHQINQDDNLLTDIRAIRRQFLWARWCWGSSPFESKPVTSARRNEQLEKE